jgi:hypothetical protein
VGFFLLGLFCSCHQRLDSLPTSSQKVQIQIAELKKLKEKYEGQALQHEDLANRLQFENSSQLEARRHMQLAEENRAKAQQIQEEIDRLESYQTSKITCSLASAKATQRSQTA